MALSNYSGESKAGSSLELSKNIHWAGTICQVLHGWNNGEHLSEDDCSQEIYLLLRVIDNTQVNMSWLISDGDSEF